MRSSFGRFHCLRCDLIAFSQTRRSTEILAGFYDKNDMVAGTRQVYSYTWRVPSSCILVRPLQGLPSSTEEGARLFLYRARGSAFDDRAEEFRRYGMI